jgi:hypothetical protein
MVVVASGEPMTPVVSMGVPPPAGLRQHCFPAQPASASSEAASKTLMMVLMFVLMVDVIVSGKTKRFRHDPLDAHERANRKEIAIG